MKTVKNNFIRKVISYAAVYLLCCIANSTFANYSWKQKADLGSIGRAGPGSFEINGKGYIGAGYDMTINRNDFWEYDPTTNVWTQKADFGGAGRHGPASFAVGGKGYMGLGTITYPNYTFVTDWWEYDPTLNTWTQKGNFPGAGRYEVINFTIGTKGYMGTGWDQVTPYYKDFWEYDPALDTWTQKANFAGTARISAVGFAANGKGYAGTGYDNTNKSDFWEYDPSTNAWTAKANFPAPARYGVSAFVINNEGFVGSGGDGTNFFTDFYKYDAVGNSWSPIAAFTGLGRKHTGSFGIGLAGYVGAGSITGGVTNTFYEYSPDTVNLTPSQTNVNCFGESTGAASVVATGGVQPYTYLWSGGETTDGITGLAAGSYSVTVTDANGTSASQSFLITGPASAVSVSISGDQSFCTGGSTTLTANASGGTGSNYGYSWSSGETTQSITAGASSYTVLVTDENGCTNSAQVTVSENQLPSCTISGGLQVCQGGTTQLCAPAGLSSYSWSNGETSQCITATAGSYSVNVTNQSGCSSTCSETVITGNGPSCSISGNLTVCQGGSTQLCAPAGLSNYSWSNGATSQCINATAGSYSVTVADQSGCSSTCSETVITGSGPTCSISGNLTVCQGGSTQLCAPAGLSNYSWSNGATTQCITATAGSYSVTLSDQSGCSSTCSETVTTGNNTSCSITGSTTVCTGGTTQLCASAGASYVWNTGATTQCINAGVGNYSVTVTDNGGCTSNCIASVSDAGGNCCTGFRTQTQGGWGANCNGNNPGCYMTSHFAVAFPAPNFLTVGCSAGFTLKLTSAQAVTNFLPSGGNARALTSNLVNPGNYNNVLAGQVVAATLSVQFDLTDPNFSAASTHLQDLVILSGTFAGMTVGLVLTEANNVLGGCASQYTAAQLNAALTAINENYDNGISDNGFLGCNGSSARFTNSQSSVPVSSIETLIYPNPFYSSTNIRVTSREDASHITVEIYDLAGTRVKVLFDGKLNAADSRDVEFDGYEMTPGVYICRITSGSEVMNTRLVLMK